MDEERWFIGGDKIEPKCPVCGHYMQMIFDGKMYYVHCPKGKKHIIQVGPYRSSERAMTAWTETASNGS